ncbi:MAG: 1-deoxy-D-xylulose-5-phosphate synthase [Anaeroplasmataceae bacterium]
MTKTKNKKTFNLEEIENPLFLAELKKKELNDLAYDIRKFLIKNISKTGGHLSSNLGVVELTIALHKVFNEKNDKIIFDVGHQSYTHKILTGRAKEFSTLRKLDGLSGYINYEESPYDVWESGHSSTSISALEGFLEAKEDGADIGRCVAVIGDSSIASGIAFEALNHLGSNKGLAPIIILNDNKMGISRSVGSLNKKLGALRSNKFFRGIKWFIKTITITPIRNLFHRIFKALKSALQYDNIFETLGYDYFGPIDGNDIGDLLRELKRVKKLNVPCVVHVVTKKGKGYELAENDTIGKFHSVPPFNIKTGEALEKKLEGEYSYTEVVLDTLYKARANEKFSIIDSAMILGNDIEKFSKTYPNSFIEVGIAEEHAAVLAASLALNGVKPVLLYYSTFIQRAYDEILNDIARQNLSVVIGIDRAGIVGPDGSTHQGIYDISMLSGMPNMKICMGYNAKETKALMNYALTNKGPIAIRYPKGYDVINLDLDVSKADESWSEIYLGTKAICITYGPDVTRIKNIIIDNRLNVLLINARFIKPLDTKMLDYLFSLELPILVYEQVVKSGSLFSSILTYATKFSKMPTIKGINIDDDVTIKHGDIKSVLDRYGLGDKDILEALRSLYDED